MAATYEQTRWNSLDDEVKWAIWTLKCNGILPGDYLTLKDYATQEMIPNFKIVPLTVKQASRFEMLAKQLQELWPKGMKDGKYRWRGETQDVRLRLKRVLEEKCFENVTDEDVLRCARIYLADFDDDKKYMCILPYFILKMKEVAGKKVYHSKLANMLLSKNEAEEQYEVPVVPDQLDYGEQLG